MTAPEWLDDADVLALMRELSPVVEHRRHHGLSIEDAEVYARTVLASDWLAQHVARAVAEALRGAADECMVKSVELREAYREHNAGRDPSRPRIRPDLDTWAAAEEAVGNRLRARAEGQS